jgi:hypothetical protein
MSGPSVASDLWPPLPLDEWQETRDTLHMWTQIVGKIRLAQTPLINHWWNVPLYVTSRGLTTSAMPWKNGISFQIDFDFIDHQLVIATGDGRVRTIPLAPSSVADFYGNVMEALAWLGIHVKIWTMPVEIENPVRFTEDTKHASYDRDAAQRFWRILVQAASVMQEFRSRFIGKCSPIHFFWGSFDLAVSRFSGRLAPERPGADRITREAYSHEVSSAGFWPGGGAMREPVFYSYTTPEPAGFREAEVRPTAAFYSTDFSEFLLPYDAVRTSADPNAALLEFLQSTYEAGASRANWDRAALERQAASS